MSTTQEYVKKHIYIKILFCSITPIFLLFTSTLFIIVSFLIQEEASAKDASISGLNTQNIPSQYIDVIEQAGKICSDISSPLIAAQIEIESNWNPKAVSSVGAEGISQFLPSTFDDVGVDGNRDGNVDIWDPYDSIYTQGIYMCSLANGIKDQKLNGDIQSLTLAAYNTGLKSVFESKGIPNYPETINYVSKIKSLIVKYSLITDKGNIVGTDKGIVAVTAAKKALGTFYHLGGSCIGFTNCDCASLVKQAWHSAGIELPIGSNAQSIVGTVVNNTSDLQAGDLLFSDSTPTGPGHVVMYEGNGYIIEAPHTGDVVKEMKLDKWLSFGTMTVMKHIG